MEKGKNLYFSILSRIKQGSSPAQISKEMGIKKQRINYYLATLKRAGCVQKIGYGVWEYIKPYNQKEVQKTVVIGRNSRGGLKTDTIRGHGFLFNLKLPNNFRNWDKREYILKKLKINYNPYYVGGVIRGQRLTTQNTKVALTNKSIIINFPESYIAETATLAKKDALAKFLRVVKHLERLLKADFSNFGKYKFKVSRQHYALIKNSLARQYLDEKKKLYVYSDRGLWLLIDNSFNLSELETVHKDTAEKDIIKVQDFFNGLKKVEGYTPQLMIKATAQNAKNLNNYAIHLKSHVASVQQLGSAVTELTKIIRDLANRNI